MEKKSKKAVSLIISTVLLISLAVVLGIIIWNFSASFLKKQEAKTEGSSFYYDAELHLLGELATGQPAKLGVKRIDNEQNTTGIRFVFEGKGISNAYDNYTSPPNTPGVIEVYEVTSEDIGMEISEIKEISVRLLYGNDQATEVLSKVEVG